MNANPTYTFSAFSRPLFTILFQAMLDNKPYLPEGIKPITPEELDNVQVPSKDGAVIKLIVSNQSMEALKFTDAFF